MVTPKRATMMSAVDTSAQSCATPKITYNKRMRESFPFAFKVNKPKSRAESGEWMQKVPMRFDNIKNDVQNAKLNYGLKFRTKASSYIDGFKKHGV